MTEEEGWVAFLERALWGLRQAAGVLATEEGRAPHVAKNGWWRDPTRVNGRDGVLVPSETSISEALAREFEKLSMRQILFGHGQGDRDLRHLHIALEKVRRHDPGIGPKSKPTDIAIELRDDMIFDLRIEAKTVVFEPEIRSGYIRQGLVRFEDAGNPYTDRMFGAMIAYVVNDDEPAWEERIRLGVAAHVGDPRMGTTTLSDRPFHTTTHRFVPTVGDVRSEIEVRVVHFVFPVEAEPSLR